MAIAIRNCPKCGTTLKRSSCPKCNVVKKVKGRGKAKVKVSKETVSISSHPEYKSIRESLMQSLKVNIIWVFLLWFSIAIAFILVYSKIRERRNRDMGSTIEKIENISCENGFKCGEFNSDDFSKYVPSDIDIYFEGFDFNRFMSLYSEYNPKYSEFLSLLMKLNSSHFVVFGNVGDSNKLDLTLLFTSINDLPEDYIGEHEGFYVDRIDNYYVVTEKKEVLEYIVEARDGIRKNMSLNPKYVVISTDLSSTGQYLLIPLTSKGNEFLRNLSIKDLSKPLTNILELHKESEKSYLVI